MSTAALNIAVVGGGVSGLVAAYHLARRHKVTLYEAAARPGGHTHTVTVTAADGRHAVDTGFIVFNPVNYPRFTGLLRELNVASRASDMSFSVRCDQSGVEWCGCGSLNRIFGQRRNAIRPAFYRMLRDIGRFGRASAAWMDAGGGSDTVMDFLRAGDYGAAFRDHYLLPLGAALWSCPEGRFADFPFRFVAEFLANHHMLNPLAARPTWRTVQGGSQRYVDALLQQFSGTLRLGTPVTGIRRTAQAVQVIERAGQARAFDEVVLACHADQALRLLEQPTALEQQVLTAFPYTRNEAVLHTDTRLLPRNRRTWGAWNVHRRQAADPQLAITYNMNILQGLQTQETYCVTLNDSSAIAPERIIQRISYSHPQFTLQRDVAQARHRELLRANRTSYCGAYWGFGFHEDGVRSAQHVANAFGVAT